MNRMHRVVWSESRNAFIVAGENAQAKGKPSSTRKAPSTRLRTGVASAVVMALAALAAEPAMAAVPTTCGVLAGSTYTIFFPAGQTSQCRLPSSDSLVVTNTGSIINAGTAVYVSGTSPTSITNSGTISGANFGIFASGGNLSGDIINNAGGTISGGVGGGASGAGILIYNHSSVVNISNSSTISGTRSGASGISIQFHSTVTGGISNSATGIISGNHYGIDITSSSSIASGITNSGTISGGTHAIYVDGASTLSGITISGNNTAMFIGDVQAPNTPVTVAAGATYTMNDGNLFTVQSFNNAGTLGVVAGGTGTITGNYTQAAGATFQTYATSTSSYGKLKVNGTATLQSGTTINVYVNQNNTLHAGQTLVDVITASTLNGSTFRVTNSGYGSQFAFTAATDPNNPNAIDLIVVNATQSPLMGGSLGLFTFDMLQGINHIVQARQDENQGLSSGENFVTNRNAWVKPLGSWANQSDNSGVSGYKASTYGVVLGADGELSQVSRLGAAFSISHSNVNNNLSTQSAGVDSYLAVLYGSRVLDDKGTEFNWQGDYGTNQNNGNRITNALNAASSYTSDSFHLGAGVGRTLVMNEKTSFTPSIRADYTTLHVNGYTESGAGTNNMTVNGQTVDQFIVGVDGKVTHKLSDVATLTANLGVGYDTMAKQSSITSAFVGGGAAFTTPGINPSPTIVTGGVGVMMKSSKTVEVTARYDVEARTGFTDQTVSVKARWPF